MKCLWKFDDLDGIYESACGKNFFFETGTAEENGFRFCPFCGKELETDHANETKPEESGNTLA